MRDTKQGIITKPLHSCWQFGHIVQGETGLALGEVVPAFNGIRWHKEILILRRKGRDIPQAVPQRHFGIAYNGGLRL